jgi:hypothetical protein
MHRRLEALERRLVRLTRIVRAWSAPEEHRRALHRARKVIAELTREGMRRAGVDPDDAVTLRGFDTPEPPLPARRPPWRPPDPREVFLDKIEALAERLRGRPPDLANASPAMLFAYYCLGDGAVEAPG